MKISIITINLNNSEGLKQTIASVASQTFGNIEYIIVDGASTDGSIDVINQYSQNIYFWLSERDTGIYNAMNKGIKVATGDYLLFLNSGDTLINQNIIKDVTAQLQDNDLVYGNLYIHDGEKKWIKTYSDKLDFAYFLHNYLPHPATFIKKGLFDRVGLYNETYKIVSDWEFFNLAVNKFNCSYKYIQFVISNFKLDGISSNEDYSEQIQIEIKDSLEVNFPTFLPAYRELIKLRNEYSMLQQKYYTLQNSKLVKLNQKVKFFLYRSFKNI